MQEILVLIVFLIGCSALAGSTHSRLAAPEEFRHVPMICSNNAFARAASVATTKTTILSAAHIFFDEGAWNDIIQNHGNEIRKSEYFEIDGTLLQIPSLQNAFLNTQEVKVKRVFLPLDWTPFPDEKIPKKLNSAGQEIEKPSPDYDLIVVELEQEHGLPTLELNLGDEVSGPYKIVGFGPDKLSFEKGPKNPEVCNKPMLEKRIAEPQKAQFGYHSWEIEARDEHGESDMPGTTKGDSGGPLLDAQNRVIGIASFMRQNYYYHRTTDDYGKPIVEQHGYTSGFQRLNDPKARAFLTAVFSCL